MKNITILGAGYAGILTAKKLAKKLKKDESVSISIIDRNPFHTMLTELHEVAANRVDEDSIKIELKKVFAGRKVEVILDEITAIDFEGKKINGKNQTYSYDYLVLAAGSQPTYFGVAGAEAFAYKLWSYEDAVQLRERFHDSFRRAACEPNLEEKKRILTFYVVGSGFTGVELIGELAEYVPFLCEKHGIERDMVTLCNVDILSRAVPILPEKLSQKVEKRLKKMGVRVMLNTGVVSIGTDFIETKEGDVVTRHTAGTVVWTAGIESADITTFAGKTLKSANRGRIIVDSYLRSMERKEVFVAGDNMLYTPPDSETPVPQMVENCEHSADTVAHNLVATIGNEGTLEEYNPKFHGVMVCIGGRYGVARVGLPTFMVNLPSFFAMFSKHFINVIYFVQVLGWNKFFSYTKHEFFTIRNGRSFLGGHFSNRTPSFLMVPIRVWLGMVWLFEGIKKVVEGWMENPMLSDFFGGANAWYNQILTNAGAPSIGGKVGAVADGISSATAEAGGAINDAVESAGTVLLNWDVLGLFDLVFVSGTTLLHSTIDSFALRFNVPLMNWSIDTVMLPNETVQVLLQSGIVIAEILIGLALIGGLFTFPAAALSLILQVMFLCTTGLYLSTIWMIPAGVAVLIAGGSVWGLDYYVIPYLKKQWKKIAFVRKWYIYND